MMMIKKLSPLTTAVPIFNPLYVVCEVLLSTGWLVPYCPSKLTMTMMIIGLDYSYLIYVSMRHYVITASGDIVVCIRTAVCLSC